MTTLEAAYARCEAITKAEAKNFSYGIRLLPDEKRRAMSALYAFARRVDDVGDGAAAVSEKLTSLGAIRVDLDALDRGSVPDDDPVLVGLRDAVVRYEMSTDALRELVTGCEMDCSTTHYPTWEALAGYCRCVAGSIGRLSLSVFGSSDPDVAPRLADTLGLALQLTNILRDIVEDRDVMGRVYLPTEDLAWFGVVVDATGPSDALIDLIRYECARARVLYGEGLELLGLLDRRSRACVAAMSGIYRHLLDRIEADPLAVLDHRVSVPAWQKATVAFRSLAGGAVVTTASPHVVVIGGGLAGLEMALRCADSGAAVSLLEARPRLGGATWSFTRHGRSFDNGQHVYLRCCTAYQRFLERVGTIEHAPIQSRLAIPVLSPRAAGEPEVATIGRGALPAPLHLLGSLARFSHLAVGDRLRVGLAIAALQRVRVTDATLDEETFAAFLSRHGQRAQGIDRLFDLVTLPTVNVHAREASLLLAAKVFRTGLLGESDAADIGWAHIPLGELHGDAAERALVRLGASVRRAPVDAIETEIDRTGGLAATAVVVDGERLAADAVVLAVPHDDAAALLPPGAAVDGQRLGELGASPIVDVHLVFDTKITEFAMAAALDSPVQYIFDKTDASGHPGPGQVLSVSVSGADDEHGERPEVLIERYRAAVVELFPRARRANLVDAVVSREHEATFRGRPGTQALRPSTTTAITNLFLAGAWTDTGWPATMEGAVRSGNRAAWHVLRVLDRQLAPGRTDEERAA